MRRCSHARSGSSTVTTVGPPGGLVDVEPGRPRSAPAGPARPGRCPAAGSAPPVPSSLTRSRSVLRALRHGPGRDATWSPSCAWPRWPAVRRRRSRRWSRSPAVGRTGMSAVSSTGMALPRGQRGQRVGQAGVEHRRVDAPGQVAQLDQGLLGAAVGGVDQFADPPARSSGGSPSSPSFSLAMPRLMASAASRTWAPSCRSRSTRRSSAAESSTASARALLQLADPLVEPARAEQGPDQPPVAGRRPPGSPRARPAAWPRRATAASERARPGADAERCRRRRSGMRTPDRAQPHARRVVAEQRPPQRVGQVDQPDAQKLDRVQPAAAPTGSLSSR